MDKAKKIWKFFTSMQFAVILLGILAAACAASSFVTQGQTYAWYASRYSERKAALIMTLQLDDAYHSWWFMAISVFLCLNLLTCNVIRLKSLITRFRTFAGMPGPGRRGDVSAAAGTDPREAFGKLGMRRVRSGRGEDGKELLYAARRRAGIFGAWVCHLGILLLILGFSLGQYMHKEYTAYGVPGQTRLIGDTGYAVTIDDFRIGLREDETVEQYTADITVRNVAVSGNGEAASASVSVNHPATLFGLKFYQNSTGWAAKLTVLKDGTKMQEEVVCAGDYLTVADKQDLVIMLTAFYPDYIFVDGRGPATASSSLRNPGYLYTVYYKGEVLGMNVLTGDDYLTIDEYTVLFSEPQNYTLLQIKQDRFQMLALLGGIVVLLGLFLSFYFQPERVWAVREDGEDWTVYGESRKGGVLFRERFAEVFGKGADTESSVPEERKEASGRDQDTQ